jgi:AcrR family transcriptional regulator
MTEYSDGDARLEARRRDPRYQRLMRATRTAARGGYEAVSMRELAETTHMSLTSVYQFCSSKAHLIAEAHLEGMEEFRRMLSGGGRRSGTLEQRLLRVTRGILNGLESDEVLARTLMRAIYSIDAGVTEVNRSVGRAYRDMVDSAIGDDDIPDRGAVIETLGRVVDSAVYSWLARGEPVAEVRRTLEQAVRVLVRSAGSGSAAEDPPPGGPRRTRPRAVSASSADSA